MNKQDKEKKLIENSKPVKPKKKVEISEEAKEERRLLETFLLHETEKLTTERNKRLKQIEEEEIELRGGKIISRLQIKQFVTSIKRVYSAIFPNDNPFFSNMFRLHPQLINYNPNEYEKPYLAGKLLKQLTYDRFAVEYSTEVLPALIVFAIPDGIRLFKCHEFLTSLGVKEMIRFRDESNKMMEKYKDLEWYKFKKEYSTEYKLPFQPGLFED